MEDFDKMDGYIEDVETAETAKNEPKVFANLTYDHGFKIVLGTEGRSEKLLATLLNRLLGIRIVELQFLNKEHHGDTEDDAESFFDVYCRDKSGRRFLIEMQMWSQNFYYKRAVFYAALATIEQARVERKYQKEVLGRAKWNYNFPPVYVINFLNFPNDIVDQEEGVSGNPYISHNVYTDRRTGRELGDGVNVIFVDLERFRKGFSECEDDLEKWFYSIKNMHLLSECPDGVDGTELKELFDEARMAAWTAQKRTNYEKNMMTKNDILNFIDEQTEAAVEKGLAEGMKKAKMEMAKEMKVEGIDISLIAKLSGLDAEQIAEL